MKILKAAFTLIELIFVIIVLGILTTTFFSYMHDDRLVEAGDQLISHIRYTQHLAMIDDHYDSSKEDWYKEMWQLFFSKSSDLDKKGWAYTIFSDAYTHTGKPDPSEIATDPVSRQKKLTGGYTSGASAIKYSDKRSSKSLNLEREYGVQNVLFSGCGSTAKRLAFDHFGRPYSGDISTAKDPYSRLIKTQCHIILCMVEDCSEADQDEKIVIAIEPETGFAHFL